MTRSSFRAAVAGIVWKFSFSLTFLRGVHAVIWSEVVGDPMPTIFAKGRWQWLAYNLLSEFLLSAISAVLWISYAYHWSLTGIGYPLQYADLLQYRWRTPIFLGLLTCEIHQFWKATEVMTFELSCSKVMRFRCPRHVHVTYHVHCDRKPTNLWAFGHNVARSRVFCGRKNRLRSRKMQEFNPIRYSCIQELNIPKIDKFSYVNLLSYPGFRTDLCFPD